MATLANYFPQNSSTAIIVPGDSPLTVTYQSLSDQCAKFRRKLAALGVGHGSAVSIALPNSLEFIVRISCFMSQITKRHRCRFWQAWGKERTYS
jgi:acyl-coenzyme A synthetase/AMP-(fatty) acid ligase